MGSPRYVHDASKYPPCPPLPPPLSRPHLFSPLLGIVALPVVMCMHDELCIGNRETEHGGASLDPETALLRYVLDAHRPLLHIHTHDDGRALGGPLASTWEVQRSRSRMKLNPPLLSQHFSTSSRSDIQRRERKARTRTYSLLTWNDTAHCAFTDSTPGK